MSGSALIGSPPANERDQLILNGMFVQMHMDPPPEAWKVLSSMYPPAAERAHDSKGPYMMAGQITGIVVIILITSLRIYSRCRPKPVDLGWDDLFIVLAAIAGLAWLANQTAMVTIGNLGKHSWDSTYDQQYWMQHIGNYNIDIFIIYSFLSKVSIVCFNWRLTGRSSLVWSRVHIVCLVITVIYGIEATLIFSFGCEPASAGFSLIDAGRIGHYVCRVNTDSMADAMQGLHIGIDWLLLAIPIIIICRLQLPLKKKLRAVVPLTFGVLTCVAAVLRQYYQIHIDATDLLYSFWKSNDWSIVDVVNTICVTSIPSVASLALRTYRTYRYGSPDSYSKSSGFKISGPHFDSPVKKSPLVTVEEGSLHDGSSASSHTLQDLPIHGRFENKSDPDLEAGSDHEKEGQADAITTHEVFSGDLSAGRGSHRETFES